MPSTAATLAGHPAMYTMAARLDGWDSAAARDDALVILRRWAWIVARQRDDVNDPCLAHTDVADGLEDRIGTGDIVLSALPTWPHAPAVLCLVAARLEWPAILRDRQNRAAADATACCEEDDSEPHPMAPRQVAA
jgi:hypothetical protein